MSSHSAVQTEWHVTFRPLRTDPEGPVTVCATGIETAVNAAAVCCLAADYAPFVDVVDSQGTHYVYDFRTGEVECLRGLLHPVADMWMVLVQRGFPPLGPPSYRVFETEKDARDYKDIVDQDPDTYESFVIWPGERLE
jgi:hypothetical protein